MHNVCTKFGVNQSNGSKLNWDNNTHKHTHIHTNTSSTVVS